jgi:hypothetical protein
MEDIFPFSLIELMFLQALETEDKMPLTIRSSISEAVVSG